jgi:hypothetical protein
MSKSVILILLLATCWASNPDTDSFGEFINESMKGSSWIERTILSKLMTTVYKRCVQKHDFYNGVCRKDYKFFSLVKVPEDGIIFVGLLGVWFPLKY